MNNEEKERHTFDGMEPVVKSVSVKKPQSFFGERPLTAIEMAPRVLRYQSRRDFLVFGAGALAALAGAGFVLPQQTLSRMGMPRNMDSPGKERFLNKALRIDDDVAEALYSGTRRVPTYTKSQITSLKNNYNGATPDPSYITGWNLTLSGLASGLSISLDIRNLLTRFSVHEQITRLVCVEGWSGIAWWAGLKFDDLLRAYPPMSQAKWARVESSVNLDASGNHQHYICRGRAKRLLGRTWIFPLRWNLAPFKDDRLLSHRSVLKRGIFFAESHDPKVSIDTIVQ